MFPIKSPDDLQRISREAKWQWFEKLVGWIFDKNGFEADVNRVIIFREDGKRKRRQFDVIAERFGKTFLVECKKWKRPNSSGIRNAAERHLEKSDLFKRENKGEVIPVVVTLMDENIIEHNGVPVIPIDKLNTFINQF